MVKSVGIMNNVSNDAHEVSFLIIVLTVHTNPYTKKSKHANNADNANNAKQLMQRGRALRHPRKNRASSGHGCDPASHQHITAND